VVAGAKGGADEALPAVGQVVDDGRQPVDRQRVGEVQQAAAGGVDRADDAVLVAGDEARVGVGAGAVAAGREPAHPQHAAGARRPAQAQLAVDQPAAHVHVGLAGEVELAEVGREQGRRAQRPAVEAVVVREVGGEPRDLRVDVGVRVFALGDEVELGPALQ
ncbi:MAG: hypothetical protein ACK559_19830, partial [bacterium]